jgi:alkylation response protein AidB-like acyl-CoA dehydrogenase
MTHFSFTYRNADLEAYSDFRQQIRRFLSRDPAAQTPRADCWSQFDAGFSRRLAEEGLLGLTWPKQYGGQERSALERFILLEELLAAGVPVAAHWISERQVGPLLLRYGTEAQKEAYLPAILRAELFFCIGLSEPDSGSDLASLRTRADRTEGGWIVNGRKIWTSNAHRSHFMVLLCRTSPGSQRHQGLSQLIIDMKSAGLTIRPIPNISREHEFNEVTFDDVFVPEDRLIGSEGNGWEQVTSELAFERSGPERFMSSFVLLRQLRQSGHQLPPEMLGELTGRFMALRSLSISVAAMLDEGKLPNLEAALVKELGSRLEQDIGEALLNCLDAMPDPDSAASYERLLAQNLLHAPSYSIRGGAREILRGIIARGLGMR